MTSTAGTGRHARRLAILFTAIALGSSGALAGAINAPDAAARPKGDTCPNGVERKIGTKWYRCEGGGWVRIAYV